MAVQLAIIVILGLIVNLAFIKIKLPGLLGMLILGIILGPSFINIIGNELLTSVGKDYRTIALIIILIRAGLGIKRSELKKVSTVAMKMSFIPVLFEGFTVLLVSKYLLDLTYIQAGILGFIIAAVSPAVVVPSMLKLKELGYGSKKAIPTMILAAASVDDVVAITIFSTFMGLSLNRADVNITYSILGIPLSIILGIILGIVIGVLLVILFKQFKIRDSKKVLIVLGTAILLYGFGEEIKNYIPVATLIGIMTIGFVIMEMKPTLANRLANKFNKLWILAEIILFVLVGALVELEVAIGAGIIGLFIIFIGLLSRSIGVYLSTLNSNLNIKERVFCIVSYSPKATVQAAIGAIPLERGIVNADIILAIAVLSIVITAPIGALGINLFGPRLLEKRQ
ncbi:cation:proton antiporter domain-containing protein [Haloplasma contractile]